MTRKEHLLTILMEECSEVAKAASKALRFGLDDVEPNTSTSNATKISSEISDIIGVAQMLVEEGHLNHVFSQEDAENKKARVSFFLGHSLLNGTLTEESNYQPKIKELEEKVKSLEREQGIIGSLTLRLERAESVIERRSEMLRISKKEAGYSNDISFDDIWKEVLEKAQKYDQLANK